MLDLEAQVVLTLGLLLAAAFFAGGLAGLLRLPRVTIYLLVGLLLGPSVLGTVPREHVLVLEPLRNLAIALVLFHLGCQFPLARAKSIFRKVTRLSLGEMAATFALVFIGLWLLGAGWEAALLLGTMALATAPATTILVLKETESEGTITDYAQALVAINNLVAIVAFEFVFLAIAFSRNALDSSLAVQLGGLARDLLGSLGLGVGAGLMVSYCYALVAPKNRLVLLAAVTILLLGLCEILDTSSMLAFLAMGVATANTSYSTRQILAELDRLTGLLCVVFFVTSGVELNLDALAKAGLIGTAYIVLRSAGKYFGIYATAGRQREQPVVGRWLGAAIVAQAGAAIALAAIAKERFPIMGGEVQTIILGTVAFFEIAGPILIRQAVLRAGEVPLAYAFPHTGVDLLEQARTVWNRALLAFGLDPWHRRETADLTVREIMRKNVHPIVESWTFEEILSVIEHSRDHTYPVVNAQGELTGLIRYRELSQALADHSLGPLVRAEDVMTSAKKTFYPDDLVSKARQTFNTSKDDCLPVVSRDPPGQLLGVIRRRDVLRLLIRRQPGGGAPS
ncbi:MAG: cation:proton antiporter [Pirellulales bacterium]|nr:cation:proton antiporter [Pirellulales bacterium]